MRQNTSPPSICETDEATATTSAVKQKTEAQRGQTTCPRLHRWPVPTPGICLGLSGPQGSLLSSTVHWVKVDLFLAARAGLGLLGPRQQGGWSVRCMRPSLRF